MGDYFHSMRLDDQAMREVYNLVRNRRGTFVDRFIDRYNETYFRELVWTLEDRAWQMMLDPDVLRNRFTCRGRRHHDFPKRKNSGILAEWTVVQTLLFKIQTGTFATQGLVVCPLPQTVVVLSKNAESFQVLQRLVQWDGFTADGSQYDCGSHFGKQYVGSVLGSRGHRG